MAIKNNQSCKKPSLNIVFSASFKCLQAQFFRLHTQIIILSLRPSLLRAFEPFFWTFCMCYSAENYQEMERFSVWKSSLVAKMIKKKKRILNEYAFFMTVYLFQVQALWLEAASWPKTLKGAVMKPYLMVQRSQVSRVKSILIFLFRLSWLLQSYAHLHIAIASKDIT